MARNRQVGVFQLQMWLGFVGFFGAMAWFSVIATVLMGRALDPVGLVFAIVLLIAFIVLLRRYRAARSG